MAKKVGVASIIQETNTFAANRTMLHDFEIQGIWFGQEADRKSQGLNIEIAGSLERLRAYDFDAIPLMRAWAMSGGIFLDSELTKIRALFENQIHGAGNLDGLILHLHGALVSESDDHADAQIVECARKILGAEIPIVVTHDLHANPSRRIIAASNALIGYRTYPHVDQGDTGRRAADLMNLLLTHDRPLGTVLKKLNMIIPAETMGTNEQPLCKIRDLADSLIDKEILDISLFPVQPWIDVSEVGFGISIVHAGNPKRANQCADAVREAVWKIRSEFHAILYSVEDAIKEAIKSYEGKMQIIAQSSDAPTGGSTGDDSRLVAGLVNFGADIPSACTVVDQPAVVQAYSKLIGDEISLPLGFTIDSRWGSPVVVKAKIINKGQDPVILRGPVMNGQEVSIGRWVVLQSPNMVKILVTESGTPTFDPAGYEVAGIDLDECVIVHVRSPLLFKSGFAGRYDQAFSLDLDGPTTPSIKKLKFEKVPRPMIGLDEFGGALSDVSSD